MALRFLKIAVVYLVIGALLGLGMGMAGNFTLAPVHAHVLLLGWASLALAGVVYHLYPIAADNRLATWHFRLHNAGLPVFVVGLLLYLSTGNGALLPLVAGGATIAIVGLLLFAANVLRIARPAT